MKLTDDIKHFIASPVMIIAGTRDADNQPAIGRGVGARISYEDRVEIVFSSWQWPETAANITSNGQVAITFARPADYVSYQLKGDATLRAAEPEDLALAERYCTATTAMFAHLGVEPDLVRPWLEYRDAVVANVIVRELYVQTPGPKAGTTIGAETR
ncbi:pyridoxamine 5'-phosphate oxidase family protein [Phyllobacterium salinisoli]|uniref:Pyridoxamine 5'-phosphate oxidase family protein n=1 Tax=Phyllobacterium salinisoli TaxID=1899321 RepID=A0A368K4T8_9HYPH|nr:pyridoxamine 5'-phosphate oxidase family protein [Phyllobacterium salinisoli]RCS23020.1 pyridoxamine 5'-phosphate oxidase family protein [Phyllobacterium salinisoli]